MSESIKSMSVFSFYRSNRLAFSPNFFLSFRRLSRHTILLCMACVDDETKRIIEKISIVLSLNDTRPIETATYNVIYK